MLKFKFDSWNMLVLITILTLVLYSGTFSHGYVYDDFGLIKDNYLVQKGVGGISEVLTTEYRKGNVNEVVNPTLYRPLSMVMFALEWELFPNNPSAGHVINVLCYILLCFALWSTLTLLLSGYHQYIPAIACLLFLVHPIHTEVVANIKSRDELLGMLFGLLTILTFIRYIDGNKLLDLAFALGCFALALLSKESSVVFLGVLAIALLLFRDDKPVFKLLAKVWPLLVVFCIYLFFRWQVLDSIFSVSNVSPLDNFLVDITDISNYYGSAFSVLFVYLSKLFVPYSLLSDASYSYFPTVDLLHWDALLGLSLHLGLLVWSLLNFRKQRIVCFSILLYLGALFLVSNLVITIGTSYGERLLFIPSIGIVLATAFFINQLIQKKQSKAIALIILVVLSISYAGATLIRNQDWESNETLFAADLIKAPNSARLNLILAIEYVRKAEDLKVNSVKDELLAKANRLLDKSVSIYPPNATAYESLGKINYQLHHQDKALDYFNKAIKINPDFSMAYNNMGKIYFDRGQYNQAVSLYSKTIELTPYYSAAYLNLGSCYGVMAHQIGLKDVAQAEKLLRNAISSFKQCLALDPSEANALLFLTTTEDTLMRLEAYKRKNGLI